MGLHKLPHKLLRLYQGLINIWYGKIKGEQMNIEMTPESVMKVGKIWGDAFLSTLTTEERLNLVKDVPVHERIKDVPVHERMKDIPVHERIKDIPLSELEAIIEFMKKKKVA
ncbi:MAG: hypothetical protein OMM_10443 [Candidatus Magnetoglobus multicellularis str. Araruama]|uniref:Uncharacterized protein n=1 Tax=Candidatus Magnetoglobus multicellularis str. Araruama TaxID=890399 RepID=A0A1V1P0X5_9BACT|nr:MAG: hypothetical protein OMM_10443 [Candidatus Magnetoglobus multicellularis str. Araruama]